MKKDIVRHPKRIFQKAKELHLYLDLESVDEEGIEYCYDTYRETQEAFETTLNGIVRTTIPFFLSFEYADKLFVHVKGKAHEITLDECEGTQRCIRLAHNLPKMLFAGEFDWFNPYIPGYIEIEFPEDGDLHSLSWLMEKEREDRENEG